MKTNLEREYDIVLNQMAHLYELRFNTDINKDWKHYVELTTELEVLTDKLEELEYYLMKY